MIFSGDHRHQYLSKQMKSCFDKKRILWKSKLNIYQ